MRWADCCHAIVAATLCIVGSTLATAADQSTYGKVDTFEPGKQYKCVPSADRKSWDCAQTGKATNNDAAPAARHDEPAPAVTAKPTAAPAPIAATPPATTAPRTGKLPSYLLAPGARDSAAPAPVPTPTPVAARKPAETPKPVAAPAVHTFTNPQLAPTVAAPPPAPKTAPPPEPKPAAAIAEKPVSPPSVAPAPAPAHPRAPASDSHGGSSGFLALPGDEYVIELAHAASEDGLSAPAPPRGDVYELHLRQNGADVWLLVWGSFVDVSAARAARGELPANAHAGWPRRIAPLQAEMRRAQE